MNNLNSTLIDNNDNNDNIDLSKKYNLSRKNIELFNNFIRKTDTDEHFELDLFCYENCKEEDNELIKNCRGIVFNKEKIVMKSFPYTIEYNHTETEKIEKNIASILNDCSIYNSHEGTLIRMFYFKEKWFITTHRKLNAFKSKWSSYESFGTLFVKALEEEFKQNSAFRENLPKEGQNILHKFEMSLDKNKQYMFIVRNNNDNRIVCLSSKVPTLYHVGTFVNGELVLSDDICITKQPKLKFNNISELQEYVNKINIEQFQGVIIFAPNNKQFKILNKDYQDLFNVRGNVSSIKFRYLQIRMNDEYRRMLEYLYPEFQCIFDEYERILYEISKNILNSYIRRYIKKEYINYSKEEFNVIKECHGWHIQNRSENKINLKKVSDVLNKQKPSNLNKMIRNFKILSLDTYNLK